MEALGGVEPPTNSLGNCCSIHLSYRAAGLKAEPFQFTAATANIGIDYVSSVSGLFRLSNRRAMVSSRTWVASALGRKPSANSSPPGASSAPDTMRIGTSGLSSFISLAISVPVLALRKWSAITKLIGLCFSISSPASPDEAVRTLYPALLSSSLRTRNARSSSSIHRTTGCSGLADEDVKWAPTEVYAMAVENWPHREACAIWNRHQIAGR